MADYGLRIWDAAGNIQLDLTDKITRLRYITIAANCGTITAGLVKSSDGKIQYDLDNKWIKVWDAQATPVLRVHLGYIP